MVSPTLPLRERIDEVETGLLLPVVVRGETPVAMRLLDRMRHYQVPAVSLAVINGGVLEWARAYGVLRAGDETPATISTPFQAGSISKPVAAVAALRLVEQRRLDLDEPVNHRLRSWHIPESEFTQAEPVTLRRLLAHTAGVTVHGFPGYATGARVPTLRQVLDGQPPANTEPVRVDRTPGGWRYSGGGYTVVQQLLEDVTGKFFDSLVRELVLAPLGMDQSSYEPGPGVASGHTADGQPVPGGWHVYPELAAAGLWSTPSDLAQLVLDVQRAAAGQPGRVVSASMASALLTPESAGHGLGVALEGQGEGLRFGHGGDTMGYQALSAAYAYRGQGVVVMTNGERGNWLIEEIVRSVARAYGWPDYAPKEKAVALPQPAAWARYAGRYVAAEAANVAITIEVRNDALEMTLQQPGSTRSARLWPESDTRFFRKEVDFEIEFDDAAGEPSPGLTFFQSGAAYRAIRADG